MLLLNLQELSGLLYAYDLFMMSETVNGLTNMIMNWKDASVSKGLKVTLVNTKGNGLWRYYIGWLI